VENILEIFQIGNDFVKNVIVDTILLNLTQGKYFMSKILCTGGAGFIGSHLVDKLIELGHEVIVVDNLSTGKAENINPKADFINWDISEYYTNGSLDYIFHLAALPSVPYSIEHPTKTHRVNVNGTYNILKSASDMKVKKVIFASTAALYGECEKPARESDKIFPKSPYALHKAIGEAYMGLFSEVYGLPTISLRFFNVYGKRCDPNSDYSLVISKFLKLRSEKKPLSIYGNGRQTRDFVYIDDVVDACILAMESEIKNEVINICTGKEISINDLADIIGGEKVYLPSRKGDVFRTIGNNMKAKALLQWTPKVQIWEGIRLMEEM